MLSFFRKSSADANISTVFHSIYGIKKLSILKKKAISTVCKVTKVGDLSRG